jgi:prepilin-type N-terminal cleavage/methylation domain-containing protein
MTSNIKAFTLIELAIVIVVVGLIITGIIAAQSLIDSSKRQAVISDYQEYNKAVSIFYLEYDGYPGDFKDAVDYWGDRAPQSCFSSNPSGTRTCNGNGDKKITYLTVGPEWYEPFRFWQHLSISEILLKDYSGKTGSGCSDANFCINPGDTNPEGPYQGTAWNAFSNFFSHPDINNKTGKSHQRNFFALSNPSNHPSDSGRWNGPSLTANQAYSIDKKIDDGKPFKGIFVIMSGSEAGDCLDINNAEFTNNSAQYNLSNNDIECLPLFDVTNMR